MITRLEENPFDLVKASDFSATEIVDYWVDISNNDGGLVQLLQPKLRTPTLILGGKGSGKTHLMRYCSAPVRAALCGGDLGVAVANDGYLGIYIPAEGLNSHKFEGKGQHPDLWLAIFNMYFELWLATTLLASIGECVRSTTVGKFDEKAFVKGIMELFDIEVNLEFDTIDGLIAFLTRLRKKIDYAANNVAVTGHMDPIEIPFSPGRLVFGIPAALANVSVAFSETIFTYLIDEAENFTPEQQRFLNTLIRYRSGNTTFRIGARLYGIRTYQTLGSGEPIKRGSEFLQLELDAFLRDHEQEYKIFASKLVIRRLQQSGSTVATGQANLSGFFEELDRENHYQKPLLKLLENRDKDGKERPYFRKLKKQLSEHFDQPAEWHKRLIDSLTVRDNPLLEKLNIFLLYRDWSESASKLMLTAEGIKELTEAYLAGGDRKSPKYGDVLAHFDSDLLAQLYRDCGQNVPYCGLDTLIHLSQGIPRNLIGILKQIYRRSLFSGERPFVGGHVISVESQSLGVLDSAAWFWEDAQPDAFGVEARESVEALAVLFRTIRYSDKPSECDLCTFAVDEEKLTRNAKEVLQASENWSYLIKVPLGHKGKTHRDLAGKYQLGPMLAPRWGVSVHRRGTLQLQMDLANAILDHEKKDDLRAFFLKRVSGMFISSTSDEKQKSLL
ncbi:hypothetical protein EOS93_30935 [Rhizobium sp. RMa-01]|uniref:ORC-CDC6 family AAA ATPase n=1 Tax=unclassified Rhizobium TaxID=2613769 RepID=UPI0008DAFDFC|nr:MULTISPECIES: hypothetical protein [unclassified Rhizobium]OHV22611.1 hypothetical protein BBJ66_29550 [Rhizobium sp. RSm-3]RVU05240.1 hypothetical protein EOS93_30935 [Rhizobium sp. RMa-01]